MFTGIAASVALRSNDASPLIDSVTKDIRPVTAAKSSSVTMFVPASASSVVNVGAGCTVQSDVALTPKSILLDQHPATRFAVPDYDRARSDYDFDTNLIQEKVDQMIGYVEDAIGDLFTAANFDAYGVIVGNNDTITDANMSTAFYNLASNKIPVRDTRNLHLVADTLVYSNLLKEASWTQNVTLGDGAESVRRTAMIGQQWGGYVDFSTSLPSPGVGQYTAAYFHSSAIGLVVRVMPTPTDSGVKSSILYYRGIPIRIIIGYDHACLAEMVSLDALFGVGVLRKTACTLIHTT